MLRRLARRLSNPGDFKGMVLTFCRRNSISEPKFTTLMTGSDEHRPLWTCSVRAPDGRLINATGASVEFAFLMFFFLFFFFFSGCTCHTNTRILFVPSPPSARSKKRGAESAAAELFLAHVGGGGAKQKSSSSSVDAFPAAGAPSAPRQQVVDVVSRAAASAAASSSASTDPAADVPAASADAPAASADAPAASVNAPAALEQHLPSANAPAASADASAAPAANASAASVNAPAASADARGSAAALKQHLPSANTPSAGVNAPAASVNDAPAASAGSAAALEQHLPASAGPHLVVIDAENRADTLAFAFPAHARVKAFATHGWNPPKMASNIELHYIPPGVKGPDAVDAFIAVWIGQRIERIKALGYSVVFVSRDHFFDRVAESLAHYEIRATVSSLEPLSKAVAPISDDF
jgi:hypothetical protein